MFAEHRLCWRHGFEATTGVDEVRKAEGGGPDHREEETRREEEVVTSLAPDCLDRVIERL